MLTNSSTQNNSGKQILYRILRKKIQLFFCRFITDIIGLNPELLGVSMQNYIKIPLRGVGQVMLQNNAATGLLFLAGIFNNSWIMGLGAIIGTVIGTITAKLLHYSEEDINDGMYGFNGALVGIAIWFYFGLTLSSSLALIIGTVLSTMIMHTMNARIPAFTAPFVISTWLVMLGIKIVATIPFASSSLPQNDSLDLFSAISMGIAQVMFQGNVLTGILFLLAILVSSRMAAVYALYGSLLGALLAMLLGLPLNMINVGLFGYNAVLCGLALGTKKWDGFAIATGAILLSVLLNYGLGKIGIITLTAPFVIITWVALGIKHLAGRGKST